MAEYIDIDAPIDFAVYERNRRITATLRQLLESNGAKYQTADVRPVVMCKDCRHRDPEDRKCDCGGMERQGCPFKVADDYFCAYGER